MQCSEISLNENTNQILHRLLCVWAIDVRMHADFSHNYFRDFFFFILFFYSDSVHVCLFALTRMFEWSWMYLITILHAKLCQLNIIWHPVRIYVVITHAKKFSDLQSFTHASKWTDTRIHCVLHLWLWFWRLSIEKPTARNIVWNGNGIFSVLMWQFAVLVIYIFISSASNI